MIPVKSMYHVRTFMSKKNRPSTNMVKNVIDLNKNSRIQRFSHLDIPNNYVNLTRITILIPTSEFFDTIIDVDCCCHTFTYMPIKHWY